MKYITIHANDIVQQHGYCDYFVTMYVCMLAW